MLMIHDSHLDFKKRLCSCKGSRQKKRSFYGKKAPMGTHLATVVSMRMNRIQRTITNTYNMGYVLDLTCQYLG